MATIVEGEAFSFSIENRYEGDAFKEWWSQIFSRKEVRVPDGVRCVYSREGRQCHGINVIAMLMNILQRCIG